MLIAKTMAKNETKGAVCVHIDKDAPAEQSILEWVMLTKSLLEEVEILDIDEKGIEFMRDATIHDFANTFEAVLEEGEDAQCKVIQLDKEEAEEVIKNIEKGE